MSISKKMWAFLASSSLIVFLVMVLANAHASNSPLLDPTGTSYIEASGAITLGDVAVIANKGMFGSNYL